MITEQQIAGIAKVCHEANRAYCESVGDNTQMPWEIAAQWQRDSAIQGVKFAIDNPDSTPEDQHNSWLQAKLDDGWVYGEVKDAEKKTHPCIVKYSELPKFQQKKDALFRNIVNALK